MESLVKKRGGMAVLTAALLLGGCATLPQKAHCLREQPLRA